MQDREGERPNERSIARKGERKRRIKHPKPKEIQKGINNDDIKKEGSRQRTRNGKETT